MLFSNDKVLIDFYNKGYFQGQKGPIWTFVIYLSHISATVPAMTNVCMKHLYNVIYDLSADLVTFDLELPLMVKSRSQD